MNPLIVCRTSKTEYLTDIARSLRETGAAGKFYAYVAYYDQWRERLEKPEAGVRFEKIFGTREVFAAIDDRETDEAELLRIEKTYGGSERLWSLILSERWLVTTAAYPLFAKVPFYTKAQKLQYFVRLVQHAERMFDETDIDCVIDFANIGLFRMAIDLVAKARGIPYYHVDSALLQDLEKGDRYFISRRLNDDYGFLDADYARCRAAPESIREGREYLRRFRESKSKSIYSQWYGIERAEKQWDAPEILAAQARAFALFAAKTAKGAVRDIKLRLEAGENPAIKYNFALYKNDAVSVLVRGAQGLYRSVYARHGITLAKEPLQTKYAFMTLHYQPEASTALMAPFEVNQLAVIENIAKALPLDWQLMVKLNKTMIDRDPIPFLYRVQQLPNVHLVDHYANTREFLERCGCVITITGTAGFEGVLLGKKTVMLGDRTTPWHRMKSVQVVKQWKDLHDAVRDAESFRADDDDIAAYLQAVHGNSIALDKNYAWQEGYDKNGDSYKGAVSVIAAEIARIHGLRAEKNQKKQQVA